MDKYKIAFDAIASIIEGYETSVACNEKLKESENSFAAGVLEAIGSVLCADFLNEED